MVTTVEMPKLGNTVEDCLITRWLKHQGEAVTAGEVIAEIETDKTSFEINAPVSGVVLATYFPEGALVPVFTAICAIGTQGESVEIPASAVAAPDGALPGAALSPRARRFAREHELEPGDVRGSGPGGRVLEADLRQALYSSQQQTQGSPVPPAPAVVASTSEAAPVGHEEGPGREAVAKPLSLLRQRIAQRLRESLSSTAQYTLHTSADAGGLLAVRKRMKASQATADVNINDLVVYLTVSALGEFPDLNALLVDGVIYRHADVNMGFACDTDRGLVVPVVQRAQDLSLTGLARRMKELAAQAVEGSVQVDDLSGGTFTVTNLGNLGIESFTPVLNPPQVAVLGVDTIGLKAVRKPDGNICFIDSIGLSLTLDHQAVDGAPGARFLAVLRDKIENAEATCTT